MKTTLLVLAAVAVSSVHAFAADAAKKVDFAKDVAPIFKANCVKCHGTDPNKPMKRPAAKLNLQSEADALKPGKSGNDVVPGDAKNSLLFKLLAGPVTVPQDDGTVDKEIDPMPKVKKGEKWVAMKPEDVAVIQQWIDGLPPQQAAK
ncbi:MAG TPA: c-type cytochrome domain-containing protein [Elusimicrobiota bacterium]|nr:c-type cytochrome domain-containing protein [Elusimicrobiota bacterium]